MIVLRWAWSSLWFLRIALAIALIGWASAEWRVLHPAAPAPKKTTTSSASSSSTAAKAQTVLSTADLLMTAEGGTTRIDLEDGGIRSIRNTGGKLTLSAKLSTTRHESATRTETSATSYSDTTFHTPIKQTWTWAIRAGAFLPFDHDRTSGLEFGIGRHFARFDLPLLPPIDFGAEVGATFPFGSYTPDGLKAGLLGTW